MAAAALGHLGQEARVAIPALLNALKDEQESVRQRAGPSLLATGGSFAWALPPLVKAFEHEPLRVRKAAAAALLSSPKQDQDEEPMTARQLLDIVQKGADESRCVAALMLAARGREAASFVSSLERALEGEASSRVRWAVMWALGIARLESQNR
jgi:HEAT repeat protein